jgi:hypothetical protein
MIRFPIYKKNLKVIIIKMSELIFVSAQPDVNFFHWQCETYIHNFIQKGINPKNIHIIFGLIHGNKKPSQQAINLSRFGVNVHFYEDKRNDQNYIPSIKPYLISNWLKEFPEYGKLFFLHDADIIFRKLPDYSKFLNDDISYMSDTRGYISYNYINDCCLRYEKSFPESKRLQLLTEMAEIVGIDIECIKCNEENSGGGQYIIKNTNSVDWYKIYEDSYRLYHQMLSYQKRFPLNMGQIQFWTAEMWSLLWNLWFIGKETKIIEELNFSWATDSVDIYEKKPILHMAGVTEDLKNTKFYKGDYININPLEILKKNELAFDYVDKNNATIKYIELMKSIVKKYNS